MKADPEIPDLIALFGPQLMRAEYGFGTFAPYSNSRHSAKVLSVSRRRRQQGVSPLFLTLSVACLIGMIIVAWRNSETFYRISHAITGETTPAAAIADSAAKTEPSESAEPKKSTKPVRAPLKPRPPAEFSDTDAPRANETPLVIPDQSHASVKTDSAVAYSFNSSRSPVVYVLKKGDTVEKTLELVDATGRWSLIRTGDSKRAAFVRSEDLEPAASTKTSTVK